MPFPIFILVSALLISLILLSVFAVVNRVFDLADRRWNGLHLYFGLKIYPKDSED